MKRGVSKGYERAEESRRKRAERPGKRREWCRGHALVVIDEALVHGPEGIHPDGGECEHHRQHQS